ncbi:MAG: magnesium/cobalt transporter CorA [Bacteroidetes bacterium]|uniref:Magnesium transport protein CorA n=1 Tax=Phaeocystidibacter marisrubri TaxID=1577780 RepID=A0A6L3ZJL5_9FLAO|nr:magnesium/cobalt transporter CorA [Phaeocystidibacter marisrubri]KAB2818182.1 magnesium/cobalt transporter CorA [Phaeocystidibacter marisrubri]TNE28622.1 MAG: magnesium/cobalt transporter CorA [Bacteroidota bacterium]GGH71523.1 cobalt/magnesium transport protein CorA [Phaeocystidibacter marisrubri]
MKKPTVKKPKRARKAKRSVKTGTAPGSLIYVGEQKVERVKAQLIRYNEDDFEEDRDLSFDKPVANMLRDSHVQWINLHGIHDVDLIQRIGANFDIDKLILEDLLDTTQRPKVEEFPNCLFFTLKSIVDIEGTDFQIEQISFILTENSVISLQEKPADIFENIRERLRNKAGLVRLRTADYLLFLLLDAVIDQYFVILDEYDSLLEELQEEIVTRPQDDTLVRTEKLKRSLVLLRKSVNPLKDTVSLMNHGNMRFLNDDFLKYYSDLKDSALEVIESVDAYRQMVEALENLYLSQLSQKNNDTMQVLTVIATIFIPLTFVAGIYGMNFEYMPELQWKYSYPVFWGIMIIVTAIMIRYFRRKGWF